jgi:CRP-like cAMP-binding protein
VVTLGELQRLELFRCLPPDVLQQLAGKAEKQTYHGEGVILRQGMRAAYFYAVLSGQVRAYQDAGAGKTRTIANWAEGEFFGAEALLDGTAYNMTVEGLLPGELLWLDVATFNWLRARSPEWAHQVSTIIRLRAEAARESFEGQNPEDEINVVFARRSIYALFEVLFAPALIALILLVALVVAAAFGEPASPVTNLIVFMIVVGAIPLALWVGYAVWDWHNDDMIVTNKRVIHIERRPLADAFREEAPIQKVQQVGTVSPTWWARLLGYKTLNIQTASMSPDVSFWGLAEADWIGDQIRATRDKAKARDSLEKQEGKRKYLSRVMGYANGADVAPPGAGSLAGAETIVWRRHLWVLIRKSILPVLAIIGYVTLWLILGGPGTLLSSQVAWWGWLLFLVPLVFLFVWLAFRFLDWYYDRYTVTNSEIIDQILVLRLFPLVVREQRRTILFESVQNVDSEIRGIVHRLLRLGRVTISTSGGAEPVRFESVYDPQHIQQTLFGRVENFRERQRERETQQRSEELGEWFVAYRDLMLQKPQPTPPLSPPQR